MSARLPSLAIPFALLLFALIPTSSATSRENDAEIRALRAQLVQLKSDTQALEARLRELGAGDSNPQPSPMPAASQSVAYASTTAAPRTAAPAYTAHGPALRQAADPAPYEAASDERIGMFRTAFNLYRWIPVGSRQLVVFNTYDDAYLLDFASDCPGLLSASRIDIQNFSTRVKAGEHSVIADGQHCLITNIRTLRIARLPKALRP